SLVREHACTCRHAPSNWTAPRSDTSKRARRVHRFRRSRKADGTLRPHTGHDTRGLIGTDTPLFPSFPLYIHNNTGDKHVPISLSQSTDGADPCDSLPCFTLGTGSRRLASQTSQNHR